MHKYYNIIIVFIILLQKVEPMNITWSKLLLIALLSFAIFLIYQTYNEWKIKEPYESPKQRRHRQEKEAAQRREAVERNRQNAERIRKQMEAIRIQQLISQADSLVRPPNFFRWFGRPMAVSDASKIQATKLLSQIPKNYTLTPSQSYQILGITEIIAK